MSWKFRNEIEQTVNISNRRIHQFIEQKMPRFDACVLTNHYLFRARSTKQNVVGYRAFYGSNHLRALIPGNLFQNTEFIRINNLKSVHGEEFLDGAFAWETVRYNENYVIVAL